jgi:guanylate kinase
MSKFIVVSGPSGVGKGTLIKMLQDKYQELDKKIYLSVSCTTRAPREGEVEGVAYYFITEEEFLERVKNGDFLEYNKYGTGKYYGTPKSTALNKLADGYDVILEIDVNGYRQVKENFPDCIGVFITAPSLDNLRSRLINRGTETMDVIEQRIETAKEELKYINLYDKVIVNREGEVEEAFREFYDILSGDQKTN